MREPLTKSNETWYVVQTKPRQETRAREHLENQDINCFLPMLRVEKIRRRRQQWVQEPLFSRYLFIGFGDSGEKWSAVRSTRGVSQIVAFGGVPARVPPEWIKEFFPRKLPEVPLFDLGQRVVITEGPFKGVEGVFQQRDGETRAIVLLELLNKQCAGKFSVEALRRVV